MRILTGNDLKTGFVTWWTGSDWSSHVEDAVDVTGKEDEIASREEAARRVNVPYAIDAELHEGTARKNGITRRYGVPCFSRLPKASKTTEPPFK